MPVFRRSHLPRLALLLCASGQLSACGTADESGGSNSGEVEVPSGTLEGTAVFAGNRSSCASTLDGETVCWGQNSGGLGDGTDVARPFPVAVALAGAGKIVSSQGFRCALHKSDSVSCWGGGSLGQLGDGVTELGHLVMAPQSVGGLEPVVDLDAQGEHACVLYEDGAIACWGYGDGLGFAEWTSELCNVNQGGDGMGSTLLPCSSLPLTLEGLPAATQLAVGESHGCLIHEEQVMCWGLRNERGQLGSGETEWIGSIELVTLEDTPPFVQLDAGAEFTCGLTETGEAWCWGDNWDGQLGQGLGPGDLDFSAAPLRVEGVPPLTQISVGPEKVCGISAEGEVHCWGDLNGLFQASDDVEPLGPTFVDFGAPAVSVSTYRGSNCIVDEAALVRCRGLDTGNENDIGLIDTSNAPVRFDG